MASPNTPMHGKLGAILRHRKNGFSGSGLNDASWDGAFSGAASSLFEVEIDAEGTPDTFKWRQDGGAYTTGVSITGAAQALAEGVTILFGATTGHSPGDKWTLGILKDEPCTVSGMEAQITSTSKRILDPNKPSTWADSGGENVETVDYSRGWARFFGNAGTVTVSGYYVPAEALEKAGYIRGWSFNTSLDLADSSVMGNQWKNNLAGQCGFTGSAESFFIGAKSFHEDLKATASGESEKVLLKLFSYDPDQDGTGDHWICWAVLSGISPSAALSAIVSENISFTGDGSPSFKSNE